MTRRPTASCPGPPPGASGSVEIVRGDGHSSRARLHALHLDRNHAVLVLQRALHDDERLVDQHPAVRVEQVGGDDGVGDAGLVLLAPEEDALRGAGALASYYGAHSVHVAL